MLGHGGGLRGKPSRYGGFQCVVCSSVVNVGDVVVGYRNVNKSGAKGWDHVHAEGCADRYVSPPLRSAAPVEPQNTNNFAPAIVPTAPSSSAQPETPSIVEPTPEQRARMERNRLLALERRVQAQGSSSDGDGGCSCAAGTSTAAAAGSSDAADGVEEASFDPAALDSEDELPPEPPHVARFSSDAARQAVVEVFYRFVRPLLPKPQTDGGFKDGDPELLDMLMPTPVTLALPRAERLADLVRPQTGWDEPSMEKVRSFFALEAAGVKFAIFLPTITHRRELARSDLFKVEKGGETVGVRDCCPRCRSNRFVNVTDGGYNIERVRKDADIGRCGVRFIHGADGAIVPISRTSVCRSPTCPANLAKLQQRNLTAPSDERQLPSSSKAPDDKKWPLTKFSTHSSEYVKLVVEAVPTLRELYGNFMLFDEGGCDARMAAKMMQTSGTVASLCREIKVSAETSERAAMCRYLAYAAEQRAQADDSLAQLPSALELSRSDSRVGVRPTEGALAVADQLQSQPLPASAEAVSNSIMRRFLEAGKAYGSNDDDNQTVTTTQPEVPLLATAPSPAAAAESAPDAAMEDAAEAAPLVAPEWQFVVGSASILNVSEANLHTMIRAIHRLLKPYMTANLLKRHPGEFASHDHTFRLAARALGEASAYSFFLGERHDIFWHGAVKSTSYNELVPAMEGCERRFVRLGVSGMLKYIYDDLCCQGKPKERLDEHPTVAIWPGVTRCPYKDGWHTVHLVTSTFNSGTGDIDVHSRDVGQQIRPVHEPDVQLAAAHVQRMDSSLPAPEARRAALQRYRKNGTIRTFGPQPADLRQRWQSLIDRFRGERQVHGKNSIIRAEYGNTKGTLEQMQSMFSCIDKGCYSDPLPLNRMYTPYCCVKGSNDLRMRLKKSESVKNETVHKGANRLVQDVSRLGEDLLEVRIDFFVLSNNLKVDSKMGKIDTISPGMPHQLAFLNQLASDLLSAAPFPLADASSAVGIDESSALYEPHGFGYHHFVQAKRDKEKADVAREVAAASEGAPAASEGAGEAAPPTRKAPAARRTTAVHKGVTQNVLNAQPLPPENSSEVELMLQSVRAAEREKKKGKAVWVRAADLYRDGYIRNCAVAEGERLLLRAPTTAAMIQAAYERMAANHRAVLAEAGPSTALAPQIARLLPLAAADAPAAAEESPPPPVVAAEKGARAPAISKRARAQKRVDSGEVLEGQAIPMTGQLVLCAYMRAMGVEVSRELERDGQKLKETAMSEFRERGVTRWSIEDQIEGGKSSSKRQKSSRE